MQMSLAVAVVTTQTVEPPTATPCGPDRNPSLIVLTTRFVAGSMRWTVPGSKLVTQAAPAPTARYRASRSTGIRATTEFDPGSMRVTAPSLCEIQTAPAPKAMPSGPSDGPTWIVAIARFVAGSIRDRSPAPVRNPDRACPGNDPDRALPHRHDRGDLVRRLVDAEQGVSVEARHPSGAIGIGDADRLPRGRDPSLYSRRRAGRRYWADEHERAAENGSRRYAYTYHNVALLYHKVVVHVGADDSPRRLCSEPEARAPHRSGARGRGAAAGGLSALRLHRRRGPPHPHRAREGARHATLHGPFPDSPSRAARARRARSQPRGQTFLPPPADDERQPPAPARAARVPRARARRRGAFGQAPSRSAPRRAHRARRGDRG